MAAPRSTKVFESQWLTLAVFGGIVLHVEPNTTTDYITLTKAASVLDTTPFTIAWLADKGDLDMVNFNGRFMVSIESVATYAARSDQ